MTQSVLNKIYFSLKLVFVLFLSACRQKSTVEKGKSETTFPIKIQFSQTESYCGGARPSEEMLQDFSTPKPAAGKSFYIKKGKRNDVENTEFVFVGKSNEVGLAEFNLAAGDYCLVFEEKKDRSYADQCITSYSEPTSNYSAMDVACLNDWLSQPDFVIEVKDSAVFCVVTSHKVCFWQAIPCVEYRGPLPP